MILLKTSSQKIEKEVITSSIMKKKIRKMLIMQLSILEIFLFLLLIDNKKNSCTVMEENKKLLVYNNANMLLAPKIVKEEIDLTTKNVEESEEENSNDSQNASSEEVAEEVIQNPETVLVNQVSDVNYSVAQSLVDYAKSFVGYPYVYGGNSLTNGTDCSGFTKLIYAQYGIDLPRVAFDQQYVGYEVDLSQIQIGDLVLSGYEGKTHHVAIYIGNGQLVHALNANVGIVITDLYIMPITHVRRVL